MFDHVLICLFSDEIRRNQGASLEFRVQSDQSVAAIEELRVAIIMNKEVEGRG